MAGANKGEPITTATTIDVVHRRRRNNNNNEKNVTRLAIEAYIPNYLRRFVHPYYGDFCVSRVFHPKIMAQLMAEGFLPIATPEVLLPKLHEQRCVITRGNLHIGKSTRKKAKRFQVTINQEFTKVVQGCQAQHGDRCWLYPLLVQVFETMHRAEHVPAVVLSSDGQQVVCPVRVYSIEVWNAETGALAGGELGYTVGSIYTSLTGFAQEDSAGSVQMAVLGRLLEQEGFDMWDLGMEMDYKKSLGCRLMPRAQFVQHVHAVRHTKGHLKLPKMAVPQNAKPIVDQQQPPPRQKAVNEAPATTREPLSTTGRGHHHHHSPPSSANSNETPDPHRTKRQKPLDSSSQRGRKDVEEEKKSDDVRVR